MNKLILGDCLIQSQQIDDNTIDLIITDPPYGVEFSKGFNDSKEHVATQIDEWIAMMHRVLKPNHHAYIFIPTKEAAMWLVAISKVFQLNNILSIRSKTNLSYVNNNFKYDNQLVVFASKGKSQDFNEVDYVKTSEAWFKGSRNKDPKRYTYIYPAYFASDIFANDFGRGEKHPTAKNVDTLEILIRLSSKEGETVFDPFMGGGSAALASQNTGRNFIGIELNEDYYNIATSRVVEEPNE